MESLKYASKYAKIHTNCVRYATAYVGAYYVYVCATDQEAQKFIMLQTFSRVHISVPVTGLLCSLLASFGETKDSASCSPLVKPLIMPASLHAPCAVDW